jgi:hypothetical protein
MFNGSFYGTLPNLIGIEDESVVGDSAPDNNALLNEDNFFILTSNGLYIILE